MNEQSSVTDTKAKNRVSPATVGSFILVVSFFLPWISIFGASIPGYEVQKIWKPGPYLWAIPAVAAVAVFLGIAGKRNVEVSQLAGSLTMVALAVAAYQGGKDLVELLGVGAWIAIFAGLFLLCVAPRLSKKANSTAPSTINTSTSS